MLRCAQPSYGVRTGPNYGHDEIREAGTVKKNVKSNAKIAIYRQNSKKPNYWKKYFFFFQQNQSEQNLRVIAT